LADQLLVSALATYMTRPNLLGVAVLAAPSGDHPDPGDPILEIIKTDLPKATVIPLRFGLTPVRNNVAVQSWLHDTAFGLPS
jgi:hypothetical protein